MPLSALEKKDVVLTLTIELERMFTILTNCYPANSEASKFLAEIEAEIKTALAERELLVKS